MFEAALRIELEVEPTLVYNISELSSDRFTKARAARFAGAVVLESVLSPDDGLPFHSLFEAIQSAADGDAQAYDLIRENVSYDVVERTLKAGHVMPPVLLDIDDNNQLLQHGQSYQSIQANSLIRNKDHALMCRRTEAENNNAFRVEDLLRRGALDDYSFVVFSLAENLPECGFFTDTMSCAIQVTSKVGQKACVESAFVAGKDDEGKLFDKLTITALYSYYAAVNVESLTPAEIIDSPLLIHNSLIPNGVIDLVKQYDLKKGNTFFGIKQPKSDYHSFKQACHEREAGYSKTTLKIINELISAAGELKTPLAAVTKLDELSERYSVEAAAYDTSINPQVFGNVAAEHIIRARQAIDMGLVQMAIQAIAKAQHTAVSSSCPSVGISLPKQEQKETDTTEDQYGSLSFVCPKGHTNTRPKNKLLERCKVCNVSVKC